jgi:hypothetical protein
MADHSPKLDYQPRPSRMRVWRDDVAAEWSRFVTGFTRENAISRLKTLAWVVPLTLLIWIYAEREQVRPANDVSVPFELINNNPDRSVWLMPPQDKNLVLELHGPQGRLESVLNDIRGGKEPEGLRLEVPANLEINREHSIDALPLVRNQRLFVDNGIFVVACQPARLRVQVDQLVEREAKIVKPPSARNLDATFIPPTVKIRGPLSLFMRVDAMSRPEGESGLVAYADLSAEALKQPGTYKLPGPGLPDVLLRKPPELDDERVTIVTPQTKIQATVEVRQADKTLRIASMPVTLDTPDGLLEKYKVTEFRGALQNVTVIGPPLIIDQLEKPDFEPRPKARVQVTQQDATGERRSKPVKYDLPKGVDVVEADRNRTVEFRLVDRATLPQ